MNLDLSSSQVCSYHLHSSNWQARACEKDFKEVWMEGVIGECPPSKLCPSSSFHCVFSDSLTKLPRWSRKLLCSWVGLEPALILALLLW